MKEVVVIPDYERTAEWFARMLVTHSFEEGNITPIVSLIEQIRYLTQTDLQAVERILDKLERFK